MRTRKLTPEDFAPSSPLRKPMFFDHFSGNIHKYSEMISFFKFYPDLWYDYLSQQGGKQIFYFRDYQRVMLRTMVRFMNPYFCIPRGGSKTLIDVMALYHTAIFYPGSKLGITSGTKEQIVSMWKEKHTEIMRFFPAIKKEICFEGSKKPRFAKDTGMVYFNNGSWVQSTPVIQASKGGRRTQLSKEESALIDHTDYKDIVSPMMQGSARIPLGNTVVDPEELNGKEMSMTTSGYRNSEEFELITNVYKSMLALKGGFLFGADWRLPYRAGGADKGIVDKERQDNETEFRKNYLCEWVGTVDGAIIRMDKLIKADRKSVV